MAEEERVNRRSTLPARSRPKPPANTEQASLHSPRGVLAALGGRGRGDSGGGGPGG